MPSLVRARTRTAGAVPALVLVLALSATACGELDGGAGAVLPAALTPGQPAGTVTAPAAGDPAGVAQAVQDAITAGGGRVVAVVDHAAAAREAGVEIPPNTVVLGGPEQADVALARSDPRAGASLPPPYQVRADAAGATVLTFDSPDYLAAISKVADPAARQPLDEATAAVVGRIAPAAAQAEPAPLIGVTPVDYLLPAVSPGSIAGAVAALQRAGARGGNNVVATLSLVPDDPRARAAAAADPAPDPPGSRASSVVLISRPAAEAPLLAAAPTIGLDLPLRFGVFVDERNQTTIGYPDVRRIALRHGIPADDPAVVALAAEADTIARTAAAANLDDD
jgi:uncharacterized protein (DUF302 family)